jgi:hypothetical protein
VQAADFSTDAGNSALIVTDEISAAPVRRRKTTTGFLWLTREATPCYGRSFLVDNLLLLPPSSAAL